MRLRAVPIVAAVAALLLSGPVALAQGPVGPGTQACDRAVAVEFQARTDLDRAVAAQADLAVGGDLGATQAEIDRLLAEVGVVADLEVRVDAIEAVLTARDELVVAVEDVGVACDDGAGTPPAEDPDGSAPVPPGDDPDTDTDTGGGFDQIGGLGQVPRNGIATGGR